MRIHSRFPSLLGAALVLAASTPILAAQTPAPPGDSFAMTRVESVRGGLVYGITVHPRTHAIYVASETMRGGFWGAAHDPANGTWMSDDGGRSWRRIGPGGRNVKVSPSNPALLYSNDRYGLYKTVDGGATWATLLPRECVIGYRGLDLCAAEPDVVYAGGPGKLYVSRDGGASWTTHDLPQDQAGKPARIQVIQVHPQNPDVAFFAFYDGGPGGVWKTADGGATFTRLTPANARGMAICAGRPDTIYCSGAVSHDGGATWTPTKDIGLPAWCITVHPDRPDVAYYSRPGSAVLRTLDGGKSFLPIQGVLANYDGTEVEGMAVDAGRDILWAGGDRIWRGEKASAGRVRLVPSDAGFHDISLSHIASVPGAVWACSDAQGIHFTRDGKHWTTTAMGMYGTDALHRVAPSPSDPLTVYAGHETRLFKSVDGGRTWYNIRNSWFPFCLVDARDPAIIYFSSRSGTEDMFRSDDGGTTFQSLGPGRFVAVDPARSGVVYAERTNGFFRSTDKGATLERISDQTNLGDVVVSASDPAVLYSARHTIDKKQPVDSALFRSDDSGHAWRRLPLEVQGMLRLAETGDGALWLSSASNGLMRSEDRGEHWQPVWNAFGALAADPWDGRSLYMITAGAIWRIHPPDSPREELSADAATPEPVPISAWRRFLARLPGEVGLEKRDVAAPLLVDRPFTAYRFTRDIALAGNNQSLALMNRGLRHVVLDGQGHTIALTGAAAIFGDDAEDVTIRNFRFKSPDGRKPGPVVVLSHSRNVRIEDCSFDLPQAQAIVTPGLFSSGLTIERCTFAPPSASRK